jgi:hypothetical protein
MTHQHKDVERTSAGRNRRSPAAVSGTLDGAAKIAELRELRWRRSKDVGKLQSEARASAAPHAANVVTRHVTPGMTGQVVAHQMCVTPWARPCCADQLGLLPRSGGSKRSESCS